MKIRSRPKEAKFESLIHWPIPAQIATRMNWYYATDGRQLGPVDEVELDDMVRAGTLAASSLVWTQGMVEWRPYSAAKALTPLAALPAAGPDLMVIAAPGPGACVCCGREVLPQESIAVGQNVVCPECQPVFVERLREANLPNLPGAMPYSSFWIRFVARMADYSMLTVAQAFLTGIVLTWLLRRKAEGSEAFTALGITALAGIAISCAYETTMLATRGATVGKMLCYLRVVRADGSPIGVGTALGRFFAEILSRLTGGIGLIMAGFDSERRGLHDRIAGTRVIDVPPGGNARTELQPVNREVCCGTCQTPIPSTEWNSLEAIPCPGCNTAVRAIVFPAMSRSLSPAAVQVKEGEAEAGCYYHSGNRANIACQECGRFLCSVCDLDAGPRRLCPTCFNGHFNGGLTPEFVHRRTLYDSIALIAAVIPNLFLITVYFTFFTAPAVVGFTVWSWRKPRSVTPRTNWRFVVALIVASINILFIAAMLIVLIAGVFK